MVKPQVDVARADDQDHQLEPGGGGIDTVVR